MSDISWTADLCRPQLSLLFLQNDFLSCIRQSCINRCVTPIVNRNMQTLCSNAEAVNACLNSPFLVLLFA